MSRRGIVVTIRQLNISLLFWLCWVLAFSSQPQGIIVHTPKATTPAEQPLIISANCEGNVAAVRLMRIYFKSPQQSSYRFVDMQQGPDRWIGQVPARFVTGERLQYFITALLANQTILTFPPTNPYYSPHEVIIILAEKSEPSPLPKPSVVEQTTTPPPSTTEEPPSIAVAEQAEATMPDSTTQTPTVGVETVQPLTTAKADTSVPAPAQLAVADTAKPSSAPVAIDSSAHLLILSPETQESLLASEVILAVSFIADSSELDTSSVQILLDGKDVTFYASKSPLLITYEPGDIRPGKHWFKIIGRTRAGLLIPAAAVSFSVLKREKEKQIPTRLQGHIYADARHEQFLLQKQNIGMGGADFSGQYGSLEFGGNLFITSLEDKRYQPRNRYSFRLGTPLIGLSAGDVYPQMNELILWGRRVRGAAGYVHLGFFNIDGVYGEVLRPVQSVTATTIGSSGTDSTYVAQYGVFRQRLYGLRPSFGSGRRFQLGLTFVKIKDDVGSIRYGLLPKDNVVFGPDFTLSLHHNRIRFEGAAAFSLITNNIYPGATRTEELKDVFGSLDLPIDPQDIDSWLIINDSTTPLNPLERTSLAYRLQVRLNYFNNQFTIGYKSIGPQYVSLGNPWLRTDIQGLYLSDRVRLWQNKVYLSVGYEGMADNFSGQNNEPVLDLRTLNYALTLYPGTNWPTLNINMREHFRNNHIRSIYYDTLQVSDSPAFLPDTSYIVRDPRERQLFRDFSFFANQGFRLFDLRHQFAVTLKLTLLERGVHGTTQREKVPILAR